MCIRDRVRGVNKLLQSNTTNAQSSVTNALNSFDLDGFTLGSGENSNAGSGNSVAWCWKGGGLTNKAADFNGSSSYVNLPSNPISGTGDYSVSVWAKCDDLSAGLSGQQYITQFGSLASSGGGSVIAKWANSGASANKIYIHVGGGYALTSYVVVLGAWTHYTVTQTGTSILFYVNGNLQDTLTAPSSPNRTSGNSSIGYYNNGSHSYFGGNIQQARIFNSVLTPSEVTELYNETAADNSILNYPTGAGCIAAYPLGENANDLSNTYNGTAGNVTFGKPGYLTRNTEGTIESTVSANVAAGFSIVGYTGNGSAGATVGHGIDTPELVIIKRLSGVENWAVYSAYSNPTIPQNYLLTLDNTSAAGLNSTRWNNTAPTNAVFSIGTSQAVNANTNTYIAYCWHSVPGYSKVGSYTGNGSTSTGNTINLGFEPAFIMIKNTTTAGSSSGWFMIDNKRNTSDPWNEYIFANNNAAEATTTQSLTSVGATSFTVKSSGRAINYIGDNYIYLALA